MKLQRKDMTKTYKKIRAHTFMRVERLSLFEASDKLREIGKIFYGHVYDGPVCRQ